MKYLKISSENTFDEQVANPEIKSTHTKARKAEFN